MDLVNRTKYHAKLLATSVGEDEMMASIVVKARFDIKNSMLVPREKQNWPIGKPVKTAYGEFDEDSPFRKQGVDVILLGEAYPANGGSAGRAHFELKVGDLSYPIDVYGDRHWVLSGDKLVASKPQPFESMPLTWKHAYGGKANVETGEFPYHANPFGSGFYCDEEDARDSLLPNLEDPENPVKRWEDQPEPVGVAPMSRESSLRIMNSIELDLEEQLPKIKKIKPSYYNNANPALILSEQPEPGTLISASGVRPGGGSLSFKTPPGTFHAYVQIADRSYVFPFQLDSITLITEQEQALLGFRCCFRYPLNPLERRAAVVYGGKAPGAPPGKYQIDWASFDQSEVVDD
jgi:hypothetical protein